MTLNPYETDEIVSQYDLVLATNLIDRLRQPQRFLQDITPMIRSGGLLLLSSPYT